MGINRAQAWEWRTALFLPPNLARGTTRRKARPKERRKDVGAAITPWSNPLYAAVAKAVGGGLARDMADDAISEVCLAIQEGRASLADLVSVARKARGRVTSSFGSDRRTVSLHLALPGTDDLLPIDLLVDERSSTWLEEMGATVW
ncbi:hypothetical protein ACH0CP_12680 [Sphingomonas sp. 179-I 2A4 NHS]|uniref:hypothetical protein n=1 Tax=unclassified Sphingomonas TaxID=196159 RepID=UPI00387A1397